MSLWIILSAKIGSLCIHGKLRISCIRQLCTETALFLSLTQLFRRDHVIGALLSTSQVHDLLELFCCFIIWETIFALVHLNDLICFPRGHSGLLFLSSWETCNLASVWKGIIRMEITAALVLGKTLLVDILLNVIAKICGGIIVVIRGYTLLHLINELSMHIIWVPNFVKLRILWFK